MVIATPKCPMCKRYMKSIHLHRQYDKTTGAMLVHSYCPKCKVVELTGDDIDFFIFGGEINEKL